MTTIEPFPTITRPQLRHDPALDRWRVEEPVRQIQMPHGRWCWVVTRSAEVREVMTDLRFSRRAAAADDARLVGHLGSCSAAHWPAWTVPTIPVSVGS